MVREQFNLASKISMYSPEWQAIKAWLEIEREQSVAQLLKAGSWDESNRHRGAIDKIDKLLNVEKDAARAASR